MPPSLRRQAQGTWGGRIRSAAQSPRRHFGRNGIRRNTKCFRPFRACSGYPANESIRGDKKKSREGCFCPSSLSEGERQKHTLRFRVNIAALKVFSLQGGKGTPLMNPPLFLGHAVPEPRRGVASHPGPLTAQGLLPWTRLRLCPSLCGRATPKAAGLLFLPCACRRRLNKDSSRGSAPPTPWEFRLCFLYAEPLRVFRLYGYRSVPRRRVFFTLPVDPGRVNLYNKYSRQALAPQAGKYRCGI